MQKQVTDIFKINIIRLVVSDRLPCSNGKDWWYTVGCQVDGETIIPMFIKTPKNIISYDVSRGDKNSV